MIDTHVHLNSDVLYLGWKAVCDRAEQGGVRTFVVIGYDLPSSARAVEIASEDSRCFAVVGVHPHEAAAWNEESEHSLRRWASHPRVVGIGEIGLDFYTGQNNERTLAPRSVQERAFREQIHLAEEVGLPVVIHCRDAYEETLALLNDEAGSVPVLLHCFAGTAEEAEVAFAHGWYIGIGGTVTYKKNEALRQIVHDAPADRFLLETDAPYLSPEPLRGRFPNEPGRIPLIASRIALVRNEPVETIADQTSINACRFFPRLAAQVS